MDNITSTSSTLNDDHDNSDSEGIVLAKVVAMIVLSLATFILGMLPSRLAKWLKWNRKDDGSLDRSPKSKLVLSVLLCFGGGALMCTTFMHMLPEVTEAIEELQADGKLAQTNFHLTELIMCCGFFTMYLVEELVHRYLHWREGSKGQTKEDAVIHRSFSIRKCPSQKDSDVDTSEESQTQNSGFKTLSHFPSVVTIDDTNKPEVKEAAIQPVVKDLSHIGHSHIPTANSRDDPVVASVRGLLVVLALSIHELFEGLAVGLQTTTGYVWYMLGAVSAHKLVIAFCVGVELVSSRTKWKFILIYISTFALVSPIGIGVGLALSDDTGDSVQGGVANAILQGMATGTLLYVVFFEVLQKERANKESGLKQLLAIMVGFCVMFALLASGKSILH
ncbi:hypothetical protein C0J52_13848 [Blattella germanica]|nr:hypothetical protein C0J52_13848 [Blattella germanica]